MTTQSAPRIDTAETPSADRAERRDQLRRAAALGALFLVVSVVMAFPSIHSWRAATPGDYGDSFLQQWILRWDIRGLFHPGASVFTPNIFWPFKETLLYTDTGLATVPASLVLSHLVDWTITFNILYLSGWVISLAATYALARWVGASRPAAVLAGLVFTFAAVRLGHYGHFQLSFAYLIPLSVWLLLRFFEERRWWQAAAVGVTGAAVFLNAGYLAVVLFPTLAVVAAGWVIASRFRPGPRFGRGLALTAAVALLLTVPVLRVYRDVGDELRRGYNPKTAVTPKNFLSPAGGSLVYGWLEKAVNSPFENQLFPGVVAAVLAGIGIFTLWARRRRGSDGPADLRRRGLLLFLLASPLALILSFGKYQKFGDTKITLPYAWVSDLPGFQSIRAFGRFTVIPLLALALLVAVGYDRLVESRAQRFQLGGAVVLGTLMLVEYHASIVMAPRIDRPEFTAVNHALDRLPDGTVLELPMGDVRNFKWAYVEAPRMVLSTIDWKPRVNGYSGYAPPDYDKTIDTFNRLHDGGPASRAALELLDRLGVRYIVIRMYPLDQTVEDVGVSYEDDEGAARIVNSLPPSRVEGVSREGAATLIRLTPPEAEPSTSTP